MIVDLIPNQTDIAAQLSDPVTFIESLLTFQGRPLRLYDYQKRIARESNWMEEQVKLALVQCRQSGKSLLCAALLAMYAIRYEHARILILSRTKEQSSLVAQYAREFILSSPLLCSLIDRDKTRKSDLVLTNGSVIFDRTMGVDSRNIRGLTLSNHGILVVDEAAHSADSGIKNILPAAYGCSHVLVSTPYRKRGYFYEAVSSGEYTVHHVPASRCSRISAAEIETMRKLYRPAEFRNEVMAEFSQGADSVFDAESVEKAINKDIALFDVETFNFHNRFPFVPDQNKGYIYSLDVAKAGGDQWILTIGELQQNNSMEIVAYHAWCGSAGIEDHPNSTLTDDPNSIIRDILRYSKLFHCRKFYVDTTSNDYFAHVLLNDHLLPVEKIVWSLQKKERMIEKLATVFRAEKLAIMNDPDAVQQLLNYSYDLKRMEDNSERRIYIGGNADDYVASLCMLAEAISGEPAPGGWIASW